MTPQGVPRQTFLERSRHYLAHEYPRKIRLAVAELPDEILWRRPNEESNSIGNLLLHLSGNISEWIVAGIGNMPRRRDRASEFAARGGIAAAELFSLLDSSVRDADRVLGALEEADLCRPLVIQGRDTTVLGATYHVVEHFAMHTGQILMLAKMYAPGTVRFYDDAAELAVPLWGDAEGTRRD